LTKILVVWSRKLYKNVQAPRHFFELNFQS
jgi:hypothetical protein